MREKRGSLLDYGVRFSQPRLGIPALRDSQASVASQAVLARTQASPQERKEEAFAIRPSRRERRTATVGPNFLHPFLPSCGSLCWRPVSPVCFPFPTPFLGDREPMSDSDLIDAVARKTGEDSREIRRRGFMLTTPEESVSHLDPECMLDLIDLPESGFIDWDALGYGCRAPFFDAGKKRRQKPKTGVKKQAARAA